MPGRSTDETENETPSRQVPLLVKGAGVKAVTGKGAGVVLSSGVGVVVQPHVTNRMSSSVSLTPSPSVSPAKGIIVRPRHKANVVIGSTITGEIVWSFISR